MSLEVRPLRVTWWNWTAGRFANWKSGRVIGIGYIDGKERKMNIGKRILLWIASTCLLFAQADRGSIEGH